MNSEIIFKENRTVIPKHEQEVQQHCGAAFDKIEFIDNNSARLLKTLFDYIDEVRHTKENPDDKEAYEAKSAILKAIKSFGCVILRKSCLMIRDSVSGRPQKIEIYLKGLDKPLYGIMITNENSQTVKKLMMPKI